jgi:hypothetical protein
VLLINPPVSLYNSVRILDNYFELGENRPAMVDDIFSAFPLLTQYNGLQNLIKAQYSVYLKMSR